MARYFKEEDIDAFRDCFYMRCKSSIITNKDDLKYVMRSVGMCPTEKEVENYMKSKSNKLSFADFLEVAHSHSKGEHIPGDILKAFDNHSRLLGKKQSNSSPTTIETKELRRILCQSGEKLTNQEFNGFIQDSDMSPNSVHISIDKLKKNLEKTKM